jgi:hypothetical protein
MAQRNVKGLDDYFDLDSGVISHGTSGTGFMSKESGFSLVLQGKGAHKDEVAVVTRGTATGADWLSNINASLDRGPSGYIVHAGFNKVYKSIEKQINEALKGKNPSRIHCIGHSLGGAVSNLVASSLNIAGHGVSLYTFGSPRVGMEGMTRNLDSKLGADNIYRVYNPADVVPLLPTYPFMHSPRNTAGLCVRSGGSLYSLNAHFMDSYGPAVENTSWKTLAASPPPSMPLNASVDQWMERAGDYIKIPGSSLGLWALGHALKGLIDAATAIVGISIVATSSVMDMIASMLLKAASISKAIGEKILKWISMVLKFAGKTVVNTGKNITKIFLSWVLDLLVRPMLSLARRAVELGMR